MAIDGVFICQLTQRTWVEEIGDGHCGIRGLLRHFDETTGTETASIDLGNIRNGRGKLAFALRTYSSSIINEFVQNHVGTGGVTSQDIEDHAKQHQSLDSDSICDSSYGIGGFRALGPIAWAMGTNRVAYVIQKEPCMAGVFE